VSDVSHHKSKISDELIAMFSIPPNSMDHRASVLINFSCLRGFSYSWGQAMALSRSTTSWSLHQGCNGHAQLVFDHGGATAWGAGKGRAMATNSSADWASSLGRHWQRDQASQVKGVLFAGGQGQFRFRLRAVDLSKTLGVWNFRPNAFWKILVCFRHCNPTIGPC